MIFKPGLVAKIVAGQKTMTRRPVAEGQTECVLRPDRQRSPRFEPGCRYVKGRTYAVQPGRTAAAVARIRILEVCLEELGDISAAAAVAEGFKRTDEFFAYWRRLYGVVDPAQPVWVLGFELARIDDQLWLLGKSGGYTQLHSRAMKGEPGGEPEAIPPGELHRLNDRHGHLRQDLRGRFEGVEPEDVLAHVPEWGTVPAIRAARQSMGLRGVDGLPRLSAVEYERVLEYMVKAERSVRDVALAMDCSVGQAHKLMAAARARLAA